MDERDSAGDRTTLESYFRTFCSTLEWDQLLTWPPDVFALANLILDHTEVYRFAVAPPGRERWPPTADWNARVADAGRQWSASAGTEHAEVPQLLADEWEVVTRYRDIDLDNLRDGRPWELCAALLTLHALADEACSGLGQLASPAPGSFEARAWALLNRNGSLSRVPSTRVRLVPKTHFAARGMTIRSLSRYLALFYESVNVRWRRMDAEIQAAERAPAVQREYNVVVLPWPLRVDARDFRPIVGPLENMDSDLFGFFEFAPEEALDPSYVDSLLRAASQKVEKVDALLLPETAVDESEIEPLQATLERSGCTFLVAGVRQRATSGHFGRNYVHFGACTDTGWESYGQDKHHRWCLDESQIRQYHLTKVLDPHKLWWEAIDLRPRMIQMIDVGGGTTMVPLICEDLARMDEVADLLRRVGPSMVVALLLDGPQLASRWPCRYAGVLADDPGAAVLTLTSFGMAARSVPPGMRRSRVVALWEDGSQGPREIELRRGAAALLLKITVSGKSVWTADGRRHDGVPNLALSEVIQLAPG